MELIIGGRGMVGSALRRKFSADHRAFAYTTSSAYNLSRPRDFSVPVVPLNVDRIFFCACPTNVDNYENSTFASEVVQQATVGTIEAIYRLRTNYPNAHIVFLSSSYVFGSDSEAKKPDDERLPENVYGWCKTMVEDSVLAMGGTVVRTSGVFGVDYRSKNFVSTVVNADTECVISNPNHIQNWTLSDYLVNKMVYGWSCWEKGILHIAGPAKSRMEMARDVVERMKEVGMKPPTLCGRVKYGASRPSTNILDTRPTMTIKEMLEEYIR